MAKKKKSKKKVEVMKVSDFKKTLKKDIFGGWKSPSKQADKFVLKVRISIITFIDLKIDISKKQFELTILNFKIK